MILIGLGSSVVHAGRAPAEIVAAAADLLSERLGPVVLSPLYRSQAWPDPSDPPFVNAVLCVETGEAAPAVLSRLHAIEAAFGRTRSTKNAPRTLDLDLLDWNGLVRAPERPGELELPHPRIADRDFVLAPLLDLAPRWRRPGDHAWGAALLAALGDHGARRL